MNLKPLALLAFCFIIGFASTSDAQRPGVDHFGNSTQMDEYGVPYSSKYFKAYPEENMISLIRMPNLNEDQFVLRIADTKAISGCVEMSDFAYFAEYQDIYLDIEIDSMVVDMRDQPQYAHLHCNTKAKTPVADVIINRNELMTNQVEKIRLHNGMNTNYFNVDITKDRVKVLPDLTDLSRNQKFKPGSNPKRNTSLVYWFYPVNTVILWIPEFEPKSDVLEKLDNFAQTKGLVPLEQVIYEFKSPLKDKRFRYYVDTNGSLAEHGDALADGTAIGTIKYEKLVYGLEKDEFELDESPVYAKKPGIYE